MLNQSRRFEVQLMLARQMGHLTRSGLSTEMSLQKLRDATDGEIRNEIEILQRYLEAGEEVAREERRFATPVATLARLAGIVRRYGNNPAVVLARAEEVLGSLGESYRVYWAGVGAFLWYVLTLFAMLFVVITVFSIFVFPTLENFFEGSKALPSLTVLTIKASRLFMDLSFFLVAAVVVFLAITAYRIRDAMKRLEPLRGFVMRIPGLASLCEGYNQALSFNLSRLLVCAGIEAGDALNEVSRLWPGRATFGEEITAATGRLTGLMRTDPLKGALVLAQRTGTLDAELEHLSAAAQTLFASQLARVREEFTLIAQILAGVVIATLLVSMYLPLFKMGEII